MSVRRFPEPETMRHARSGVCKWCGGEVKKPAYYWHRECADLYFLHTRPDSQKRHLVERDGRKCAQCGDVPQKWLAGQPTQLWADSPGVEYWSDQEAADLHRATHWNRSQARWSDQTHEERHTGEYQEIERVCALEVDHKVPLWSVARLPPDERRPFFGPDNLWLLCPRCHKDKSRREAAERAAAKRAA